MRVMIAGILLACIGTTACARENAAGREDVIRIAAREVLTNAAILIAEDEGDFAKEGIRLRYMDAPRNSSQAIPLLERRELDVVSGAPGAGFYAAVAKGGLSRIVADRGHVEASGCDYDGIMGSRTAFTTDSPTAAQVRGKKFSINSPGSAAFITDKYLASLGLSESDVRSVKLAESVEEQAMVEGSLDAMHATEPYLSRLREQGHRMLAPARIIAPGAHYAVVIFGPSLTETNRELGRRFMKAYLRGARRYAEGPTPRNVEILARRTGFDPVRLAKSCLPSISVNGELNLPWLLEFQMWAVDKGYLEKVLGPGAGVDTSFAHDAAAELGNTTTR
jgi:NitT/TauT family transport system substrate-binding protein